VYVYTYPQGRRVGTLTGFSEPQGECSDASGNVFIVDFIPDATTVYEFAHGGMSPIATLNDPADGFGCAVDPLDGTVAVANTYDPSNFEDNGDVAVYAGGHGNPTIYY
jgi:hypothetical protein